MCMPLLWESRCVGVGRKFWSICGPVGLGHNLTALHDVEGCMHAYTLAIL